MIIRPKSFKHPPVFGDHDGEKVLRTLSAFVAHRAMVGALAILISLGFAGAPERASAASKYTGIVVDAKTGKTLYSHKADVLRYPASLTKMMTMYMMFEALESGAMNKKTRIRMSRYAASKPPSKIGIKPGRSIAAEHAILALATKSANDVAAAVAEHLGGSEANFARMMTRKARQLGMSKTTFKNASGLTAKGQLTTARDMARLGIALREHFPQHYRYFSTRNFKYGKTNYRNHNRLLGNVKGVDGIKTGYTRASGFNLVSSVQSNRRSIVAVVIGGRTGKSRNAQMRKLISRYLGKASRGSKKQIIASLKLNTPFVVAANAVVLPKSGPMPVFRSVATQPTVLAATQPVIGASAAGSKGATFDQNAVMARLSQAVVPSARPAETSLASAYVDPTTTAVIQQPAPSGWVIQIGATDSKQAAMSLLNKAKRKMPSVLGSKDIYTETVEKGGAVLHRARFTGFDGKSDARRACKLLKRKKIACLALTT